MTSTHYRPPWEWTEFGISGAPSNYPKPKCSFCGGLCDPSDRVEKWGVWVCPKCYSILRRILIKEVLILLEENFGGEEP